MGDCIYFYFVAHFRLSSVVLLLTGVTFIGNIGEGVPDNNRTISARALLVELVDVRFGRSDYGASGREDTATAGRLAPIVERIVVGRQQDLGATAYRGCAGRKLRLVQEIV